jgi:hypothetical protein
MRKIMNRASLYQEYAAQLEDFWFRRQAVPCCQRDFRIMGRAVQLMSNEEEVLTAVDHTIPHYSTVTPLNHSPWMIQIVVQPAPHAPGTAPDDLMQRIVYTGDDQWLLLHLSHWGQAHIDLAAGRATAVLTPELARRPDLVSQCLLHTILLNFLIASGWGMLHASCLVQAERVLLMLAPHNTGKSTTALRLALSGYALLTDSMVFVNSEMGRLQLLGYPVGRIKLRQDAVAQFLRLRPYSTQEVVRQETKYSLDLRSVAEASVVETAVSPTQITLCLLTRHDRPETTIRSAELSAVWEAVMLNSLYYDTQAVWESNLIQLERVVAQADAYHLTIGTDEVELLSAINSL